MTLTEKADKWLTTNDFRVMGCEREAYIDGYRQALADAAEVVRPASLSNEKLCESIREEIKKLGEL
jgi:hypothetical protein